MAYWHPRKNPFSFADGHVEARDWVDPRTTQFSEAFVGMADPIDQGAASTNNPDVAFLNRGYKTR